MAYRVNVPNLFQLTDQLVLRAHFLLQEGDFPSPSLPLMVPASDLISNRMSNEEVSRQRFHRAHRHQQFVQWRQRRELDDCEAIRKEVDAFLRSVIRHQQLETQIERAGVDLVAEVVFEASAALAAELYSSLPRVHPPPPPPKAASSQSRAPIRLRNRPLSQGEKSFSRPLP